MGVFGAHAPYGLKTPRLGSISGIFVNLFARNVKHRWPFFPVGQTLPLGL